MPGTEARDRVEARIEELRRRGGVFVEAVRATRMAMVFTDPALPGDPIVFANQSFLDLSGYSMDEVLGQQPHFMNGAAEADIHYLRATQKAFSASEERQSFLLALGDAMRAQPHANGVMEVAARMLGEHLNASRIMFAEYDHENRVADIFHGWFADGAMPFPAVLRLDDFEGDILDDLRAGRTVRIDNTGPPFEKPDLAAVAELGVKALLSPPLIVNGMLVMKVSVQQHEPHHWTDNDVALVQEVSERLWADLTRVRA